MYRPINFALRALSLPVSAWTSRVRQHGLPNERYSRPPQKVTSMSSSGRASPHSNWRGWTAPSVRPGRESATVFLVGDPSRPPRGSWGRELAHCLSPSRQAMPPAGPAIRDRYSTVLRVMEVDIGLSVVFDVERGLTAAGSKLLFTEGHRQNRRSGTPILGV